MLGRERKKSKYGVIQMELYQICYKDAILSAPLPLAEACKRIRRLRGLLFGIYLRRVDKNNG